MLVQYQSSLRSAPGRLAQIEATSREHSDDSVLPDRHKLLRLHRAVVPRGSREDRDESPFETPDTHVFFTCSRMPGPMSEKSAGGEVEVEVLVNTEDQKSHPGTPDTAGHMTWHWTLETGDTVGLAARRLLSPSTNQIRPCRRPTRCPSPAHSTGHMHVEMSRASRIRGSSIMDSGPRWEGRRKRPRLGVTINSCRKLLAKTEENIPYHQTTSRW